MADCLSRLPLQSAFSEGEEANEVSPLTTCVSTQEMQNETTKDVFLKEVLGSVRTPWPQKTDLVDKLLAFYKLREDLSEVDAMLLRGEPIVVPEILRSKILYLAYDARPSIVRTKQRLRQMHWWPGLDSEVEQAVRGCTICQTADKSAKTFAAPFQPVPLLSAP